MSTLGQTQYQSDAPTSPFPGPNGQPAFAAPKFTYDLSLRVDQRLYDPSSQPRRDLARADLAESQARVRTSLFALRQEVNDAFFAAALLQEQIGALDATIDDLEARLREADDPRPRRRGGAGRRRGDRGGAAPAAPAGRRAAREPRAPRSRAWQRSPATPIDPDAPAQLPDLHTPWRRRARRSTRERARPEYAQFDRAREKASRGSRRSRRRAIVRSCPPTRRGGYGTAGPGFHQRSVRSAYGLGRRAVSVEGVELELVGARARGDRAAAEGRRRGRSGVHAAAFAARPKPTLASIDHLETALPLDDRIVSLREGIDRTATARLDEGAITASEYVDRHTEWLAAQFERARHRVELAQARRAC